MRARSFFALLGIADAALVIFACIAAMPASAKSPPMPTQKQIQRCVVAVTGEQPLTANKSQGAKRSCCKRSFQRSARRVQRAT